MLRCRACRAGKFAKRLREAFQSRLADASTTAEECISGLRTVRSFAGEAKSADQYAEDVGRSYDVGKKLSAALGNGLMSSIRNHAAVTICNLDTITKLSGVG